MSSRPQRKTFPRPRDVDGESKRPHLPRAPGKTTSSGGSRKVPGSFPPSYEDQDSERGDQDRDVDDDIKSDEGHDSEAEAPRPKPPSRKAATAASRQGLRPGNSARDHVTSRKEEVEPLDLTPTSSKLPGHMRVLQICEDVGINKIRFTKASVYYPSSRMMLYTHHQMTRTITQNKWLRKLCPRYTSLVTRIYYSILFVMKQMSARQLAGQLTPEESTFVRSFFRTFPPDKLVISSPLVPYFSNIGAVRSGDPMYEWIVPASPVDQIYYDEGTATAARYTGNIHMFSLPNLPVMYDWLRRIYKDYSDSSDSAHPHKGGFVPVELKKKTKILGMEFPDNEIKDWDETCQHFFLSAGLALPLAESAASLASNADLFYEFDFPPKPDLKNLHTLKGFFGFTGGMSWFKSFLDMATTEARFFDGSTTLGSIGDESDLSSLVETVYQMRESKPDFTGWFSEGTWSYEAQFRTTRGPTTDTQFKLGMYGQTLVAFKRNALSGTGVNLKIGNKSITDTTLFANSDAPYFKNRLYQMNTGFTDPIHTSIQSVIATEMLVEKGGK